MRVLTTGPAPLEVLIPAYPPSVPSNAASALGRAFLIRQAHTNIPIPLQREESIIHKRSTKPHRLRKVEAQGREVGPFVGVMGFVPAQGGEKRELAGVGGGIGGGQGGVVREDE